MAILGGKEWICATTRSYPKMFWGKKRGGGGGKGHRTGLGLWEPVGVFPKAELFLSGGGGNKSRREAEMKEGYFIKRAWVGRVGDGRQNQKCMKNDRDKTLSDVHTTNKRGGGGKKEKHNSDEKGEGES